MNQPKEKINKQRVENTKTGASEKSKQNQEELKENTLQ
jgi:hypothetical protein